MHSNKYPNKSSVSLPIYPQSSKVSDYINEIIDLPNVEKYATALILSL